MTPPASPDNPAPGDPPSPSNRRRPAWLFLAISLGVLVLIGTAVLALRTEGDASPTAVGLRGTDSPPGAGASLVGHPLPTTSLETFDGQPATLADYVRPGQPAVINFFASWCVPCVTEMPDLEAAYQGRRQPATFIGVNVNDGVDNGRRTASRAGITYPVVRDPLGDLLTAVGGMNMPTTVFVRPDGTVARIHTGQVTREEVESNLAELGP